MQTEERINQQLEHITKLLKVDAKKIVAKDAVSEITESEAVRAMFKGGDEFEWSPEKLQNEEPQFYAGFLYGLKYGHWQALNWATDQGGDDLIFDNGLLPLECLIAV